MNKWFAIVWVLLAVRLSFGQEGKIPQKETQRYAKLCVDQTGMMQFGRFTTRVDPLKAWAERGEGGGAMVIPAKTLTKNSIVRAGDESIPIGQLWLRKWTLVIDGKPATRKNVRMVTVNIDDKDRPMSVLLLAVRKNKQKGMQLLLFANDDKPVQVLSLAKLDIIPDRPLQLEWSRGEKQHDPLLLSILGRHRAVLKIAR